jgi:positive regulator of sigma E activity
MLSGYLAQRLGIRELFLACAAFLGILAVAGYLLVRKPKAVPAAASGA